MRKVYIVAEVGNTHEGSVGLAKQFIKYAADCGVNCVKFQTHLFEHESLSNAPNPPYFKGETRQHYFERTSFNLDEYVEIKRYSEEECGVEFMSSPFSIEAVDLLERVGVQIYKVPSGEVTNLPLLEKIAETGKKVFLSSGMSNWSELDEAVGTLQENGCREITVLQCTSEYPCPPERSGLNILNELKERYKLPVGYSDHTLGTAIAVAAVMMGAVVIEKHFTLSKKMYGSDAMNSTEPEEFKLLVESIKDVEKALEVKINKDELANSLQDMRYIFQKGIVSSRKIAAGSIIEANMLSYKKPCEGIPANKYKEIIGKRLISDLEKDIPIKWGAITDK